MKAFAAILLLISSPLLAQGEEQHALFTPKKVALEWTFHDETRVWLSANYYGSDWQAEGWHPSFVYLMSKYKPQIVKQKDGQYVITFSSEIAQDTP